MLGTDQGGPETGAPAPSSESSPRGRQALAGGEPLGPFPAGVLEHLPSQFLQARVKRAQAQPARMLDLLVGVMMS